MGKTRLLMIAASVLLSVSQFFNYFEDAGNSFLDPGPKYRAYILFIDLVPKAPTLAGNFTRRPT